MLLVCNNVHAVVDTYYQYLGSAFDRAALVISSSTSRFESWVCEHFGIIRLLTRSFDAQSDTYGLGERWDENRLPYLDYDYPDLPPTRFLGRLFAVVEE